MNPDLFLLAYLLAIKCPLRTASSDFHDLIRNLWYRKIEEKKSNYSLKMGESFSL